MRHDDANAQFLHRPPKLGRLAFPRQLLGDGGCVRGTEGGVLVAVEGEWDAVTLEEVLDQEEVALGVLHRVKAGSGDRPGGIVNGAKENWPRAAPQEPVVMAPIDLEKHPLGRHPVSP